MTTRSILLIEDNLDVANILMSDFQDHGYRVTHAVNGQTGLVAARALGPDLVILDLGLPDLHGHDVLRGIRSFSAVPVVILTAHGTPEERPHLLALGASDYLLKPFHTPELLERIGAQFNPPNPDTQTVGPITINTARCSVVYQGLEFNLSQQEFDLAAFLARHPGRVYSKAELQRALSGEPASLDEPLRTLRQKLRDQSGRPLVRALRDVGFTLRT